MAESSEPPQADTQTSIEETPGPLSFTLQVVSPSVGVAGPLKFTSLPATMTVKELKGRIRDILPSKPQDEYQRLIHRGRMLGRETETMLEIFGQETLSNAESQTLHLVLRPTAPEAALHPATTTPTPMPQLGISNPPLPRQFQPRPQSPPVNPMQAMHGGGIHGMQAQQPLPGFQQIMQNQQQQLNHAHQVAHFQQATVHRLGQLQQETQRLQHEINVFEERARQATTALQNGQLATPLGPGIPPQSIFRPAGAAPPFPASLHQLINQQQRERAAEGRQGAQDTARLQPGQYPQTTSGRASPSSYRPDSTSTYTREGVGPNGERWSVTVNETTTTIPIPQSQPHPHHHHPAPQGNPALDIQAVLRSADRLLAQNGQNNMQRSASNPIPTQGVSSGQGINRPETPGQTTPATTNSSPSASTILNPLLNANIPIINASMPSTTSAASSSTSNQPIVYLLSSPSGPRALLVTNSETYFTPRHSSRRRLSPTTPALQGQAPGGAVGFPEYRNRPLRAQRNNALPDGANVAAPAVPLAPHGNPPAGAVGAQFGQIIWLLVRLSGFIWFFTSGNPSWTRWFLIVGLGFVVFLYNTGMLNGIGELFGPIRRHLDYLIPLAGPEAALVPAQNAAILQAPARDAPVGNLTPQQRQRGELDPAEAAERILEQRRQRLANGGWLIAQIRRAEHSLLLFLASLVPGVGERHIAAREAEANAAEAARLEAIARAEAAEEAANATNGNGDVPAEVEGAIEGTGGEGERREIDINEGGNGDAGAAQAQPLIEV